jgi:hypothetical protein
MNEVQLSIIELESLTQEQLIETAKTARIKSVENILLFAACVYQLSLNCNKVRGGTTFHALVKTSLNLSQPAASQWCALGARANELITAVISLPVSKIALLELIKLDKQAISTALESRKVNPGSTKDDVNSYIRSLRQGSKPQPQPAYISSHSSTVQEPKDPVQEAVQPDKKGEAKPTQEDLINEIKARKALNKAFLDPYVVKLVMKNFILEGYSLPRHPDVVGDEIKGKFVLLNNLLAPHAQALKKVCVADTFKMLMVDVLGQQETTVKEVLSIACSQTEVDKLAEHYLTLNQEQVIEELTKVGCNYQFEIGGLLSEMHRYCELKSLDEMTDADVLKTFVPIINKHFN